AGGGVLRARRLLRQRGARSVHAAGLSGPSGQADDRARDHPCRRLRPPADRERGVEPALLESDHGVRAHHGRADAAQHVLQRKRANRAEARRSAGLFPANAHGPAGDGSARAATARCRQRRRGRPMIDLATKRIVITGGSGLLGRPVAEALRARGCAGVAAPRKAQYDLTREADVERLYADERPHIVIHLAAVVGGIGANRESPGRFFFENVMMGALVLDHARRAGGEQFVGVGTICAYPKLAPVPFRETDLWNGSPEETNAPYGIAKKMLLVQGQAYRAQYGLNAIHLLPVNLYGPHDNFDAATSHVIPALIRKCLEAVDSGRDEIVVWGTGNATREFLYVEDCAEAIVRATERYDSPEPSNVGAGFEIRIRDLALLIAELCGFRGRMTFDSTKPDGQPRRSLDVSRAQDGFGFRASTDFREGLKRTIEWYA